MCAGVHGTFCRGVVHKFKNGLKPGTTIPSVSINLGYFLYESILISILFDEQFSNHWGENHFLVPINLPKICDGAYCSIKKQKTRILVGAI